MITEQEAIQMAKELGVGLYTENDIDLTYKELTAFANAVERNVVNRLCEVMMTNGLATGHADTVSDVLQALDEELRSLRSAIRRKTLMEAAERADEFESQAGFVLWCKRMAEGEEE